MKYLQTFLVLFLLISMTNCMSNAQNTLSSAEKEDGWQLLFDGESTENWRGYDSDTFPGNGWTVEDGMLVVQSGEGPGDIITREQFGNFELKLDWRVQEGGNSGILYRILEQPNEEIYWSAPEMQILDNENHPDATRGKDGNRKAGSLYDLIPAKPQNANPFGEWNSVRIVANEGNIKHWQNGEKVVEYTMWTPEWYEMLRNSKFKDHPEFGDMHKGHIGLQDHGDTVYFRNIKVRSLD